MSSSIIILKKSLESTDSEIARLEEMVKNLKEGVNDLELQLGHFIKQRADLNVAISILQGQTNEASSKSKKTRRKSSSTQEG